MDGDRMFCHACGGVWPKDDGLTCPHCQSEFTEIIEIPPELPQTPPPRPADLSPPANPWGDHNPWEQEDTYGPGLGFFGTGSPTYNSLRTYRSPDGRFSFSSATLDTGTGQRNGSPNPMVPMMMQSFDTILQNLMDPNDRRQRGPRGMGDDPFLSSTDPDWLNDDHLTGHHPGLFPRNTDAPQPRNQPMPLPQLMEALHAEIGATRGARGAPNAFSMLSALLNMRSGDAVYSQEELDRVISQLIENNGSTGTAAPPASENAIRSLPKKQVDKEMIGVEGKAECSICMDNVELGTEVTVLPCTHWFHYDCIEAWLKQHNTCPHCRRSITANVAGGDGTCENPVVIQDSPEQSRSRRRLSSARTMRSGRSSLSSLQSRLSPRLSPRRSPEPEVRETGSRRASRGEGGGALNWFTNRFGSSA